MNPFYKDAGDQTLEIYNKYFTENGGSTWDTFKTGNKMKVMSYGLFFLKDMVSENEKYQII